VFIGTCSVASEPCERARAHTHTLVPALTPPKSPKILHPAFTVRAARIPVARTSTGAPRGRGAA